MRILLIVATLFLTACTSMQGLSVYSFSNTEIESVLKNQLPQLSEKINLMGLPVKFEVNDLSVKIGPENLDVLELSIDSIAEVNAFAFKYPIRIKLQIEGSPFYDSEKKAVFLRNVALLDSSIDAGGFKGNLGLLNKEAMNIVNAFLAENPVYSLDMNDPKIAILAKLPLNMIIVEGKISLIPSL